MTRSLVISTTGASCTCSGAVSASASRKSTRCRGGSIGFTSKASRGSTATLKNNRKSSRGPLTIWRAWASRSTRGVI